MQLARGRVTRHMFQSVTRAWLAARSSPPSRLHPPALDNVLLPAHTQLLPCFLAIATRHGKREERLVVESTSLSFICN